MVFRPDIGDALLHVTREILEPRSLEATLQTIVETAVTSLPGIDHIGITIASRDGTMQTLAATDQFVCELDRLQYDLGEGPCLHAIRMERLTTIEHASDEQRWPLFMKRAIELGLRSQMGLRLYVESETLGGLNLYSTSSDTLDPDVAQLAQMFAAHASIALGRARREEDANAALTTRKIIGQAIGIVMERYQMDEDRAWSYLARVSQHSNLKLRDVAQEVVALTNDHARSAASAD
jgi:GAF domain-containing protein